MDLVVGSTYHNKDGDKIRVLDICDNLDNKPKVVLYKKNMSLMDKFILSSITKSYDREKWFVLQKLH